MGLPGDFEKLKDKDKVVVLQQRIQFQNETIENQKRQITELKDKNNQLKDQLEKFSNSIQNQTSVISEQQTTLKDQETTILQQQMTISELQKQLIEQQKHLEELNSKLTNYDKQTQAATDTLKSEIKKLEQKIDDQQKEFNEKILEREETILALREENTQLEKKIKEISELKAKPPEDATVKLRIEELEKSLDEANNTIKNLEEEFKKQKQNLQAELEIKDVKIAEYERIIKKEGLTTAKVSNFINDRDTATITIADIFSRTKSNVMMFLPEIRVLNDLNFEDLRPMVRVHLAIPTQQNPQKIEELKSKPNIEIRDYTGLIWGIIRDNEEMLLAPPSENNVPSGLVMKGDAQIEAFGTVLRSTWARLKRI
ncbi:MAG: hypothetical protein ACTSRL_03180 [Candidatus Helarchaeota archaeon]